LKACDQNLKATLKLTDAMIELAIKGDVNREDIGCGILYGMLIDSAYKIKNHAERRSRPILKRAGG